MKPRWKPEIEQADIDAAREFLGLCMPDDEAAAICKQFPGGQHVLFKPRDILRAAGLPLLKQKDPYVKAELDKIDNGKLIAPVLLYRGAWPVPLLICDGYHRVCASWHAGDCDVAGVLCG